MKVWNSVKIYQVLFLQWFIPKAVVNLRKKAAQKMKSTGELVKQGVGVLMTLKQEAVITGEKELFQYWDPFCSRDSSMHIVSLLIIFSNVECKYAFIGKTEITLKNIHKAA